MCTQQMMSMRILHDDYIYKLDEKWVDIKNTFVVESGTFLVGST